MTLLEHKVHLSRFESNSAGGRVAQKVQEGVKAKNGRTKITTKYTTANKETKIIVNSPWVKEHCLFKDDSVVGGDKEYRRAMNFLCGYTMMGNNKHDDVPDALAMFVDWQMSDRSNIVQILKRPF
jgi:predicted phage terminase large subunit-like protein